MEILHVDDVVNNVDDVLATFDDFPTIFDVFLTVFDVFLIILQFEAFQTTLDETLFWLQRNVEKHGKA